MSKYGISTEGVESLNQLANDLSKINIEIYDEGQKLKTTVGGYGEGLGIYEDKILELVDTVTSIQRNGKEAIEQLVTSIRKLASDVQELINAGFGT